MHENAGLVIVGLSGLCIVLYFILVFWTPKRLLADTQLLFVTTVIVVHLLLTVPPSILGTSIIDTDAPWFRSLEHPGEYFLENVIYPTSEERYVETPLATPINAALVNTVFYGAVAFIATAILRGIFRKGKR